MEPTASARKHHEVPPLNNIDQALTKPIIPDIYKRILELLAEEEANA